MARKTVTIYGIYTSYDESGGKEVRAFYENRELAERDSKNYYDWYGCKPIEPDDEHIRPLELITDID